ncbi:unnamed protein product [Toxocara canis]|uniref:Carboxylesterase type B domain-containing protein n=1 Tax=Toxocara canis TaxID=6265 RepID=A0A3P7F0C3_TOXCA|nr:unnamed protein product [Toxocara canis]
MKMLDQYTTLFTNFVKTGNPNKTGHSEWQPLSADDVWKYYNISLTSAMRDNFQERRPSFWNSIKRDASKSDSSTTSVDGNPLSGKQASEPGSDQPSSAQDPTNSKASNPSATASSKDSSSEA